VRGQEGFGAADQPAVGKGSDKEHDEDQEAPEGAEWFAANEQANAPESIRPEPAL
jgi:hypothetical protein